MEIRAFASVRRFAFLFLPSRENRKRIISEKLVHGNAPPGRRDFKLVVNESVVKTGVCSICRGGCVENYSGARTVNRAEAHRARLACRVEIAASELKITENAASLANGHDFGMRCRIVRMRDAVCAFRDDTIPFDDQRSERPAAARADIFQRQRNGAPHEFRGHDLSFFRSSDCTVRLEFATRHFSGARNRLTPGPSARRAAAPGLQESELAVGCSIAIHDFASIFVQWRSEGA